jgi:copper chaperone NosL
MATKLIKTLLLGLALVLVVVAFMRFNQATLPAGPVPVVWDGEVCQHCKMHVGDPRFAAQLQTSGGAVMNFDDPGCLFDYLGSHELQTHALYFRNHEADGWLDETEVGFLPVDDSPMGYRIRAVPKATPEAQNIDWAKAQTASRPHHRDGGT